MLRTLEEKVDPKHTALVIVDMQNDFCHKDGMYGPGTDEVTPSQAIVPAINTLISQARAEGAPVIFVRFILNDQVISDVWRERHLNSGPTKDPCMEGTWGAELYGFTPEPGDSVVDKHRFSAFNNTNLNFILQCNNIKTVIVTGIYTNICVENTARDGFMMDYYVVVPEDCTAGPSVEAKDTSLRMIYGTVSTSDEILQAWAKQKSLQTATP